MAVLHALPAEATKWKASVLMMQGDIIEKMLHDAEWDEVADRICLGWVDALEGNACSPENNDSRIVRKLESNA